MKVHKNRSRHLKYFCPVFLLFAFGVRYVAAQDDSLKTNTFRFFLSGRLTGHNDASLIDSGLVNFQATSPYFINYTSVYGFLGNLGSALRKNYFPLNDDLNFHWRENFFEAYQYDRHPVSYDKLRNIHTKMEYYRGAKKEQLFQFDHSQRLGDNFAFGLDYLSIISPSFYKHETAIARSFDIYLVFETGNNKYSAFADYVSNKTDNNENGGLAGDSAFQAAAGIDEKTLPVQLDDAQWTSKQKSFFFTHQYNFKTVQAKNDSAVADTTIRAVIENKPQIFLHHDFKYTTYGELFSSTNDSLWAVNYYDSITTFDTAHTEEFLNTVFFESDFINQSIVINAGAENQRLLFIQRDIDSSLMRTSAFVSAKFNLAKEIGAYVRYEKNVAGDAKNTYSVKASLSYIFQNKKYGELNFNFNGTKQSPFIVSQVYHTNHFKWDNKFNYITGNQFGLNYSQHFFSAGLKWYQTGNYIYYDSLLNPVQETSRIAYTDAFLKFHLHYKKLNWLSDIHYIDDGNNAIVHLPAVNLHTSVFYETYIFKKALFAQTGIDVYYTSSYYSDGFMPALQQFYVQQKIKTGNYPFIDFFVNGRIKTVRFFLKMENIGAGLISKNYFATPYYPLQGRGLRGGLEWSFFN